ncbi:MAG: PilZ domain-containing protein, partial [Burkholderiales bacterium]
TFPTRASCVADAIKHGALKRDRREEPRVELSRRATLLVGSASIPCLLQNFSGKGFFIISNQQFAVGQFLDLKCELYPGKLLRCRVEVKHLAETCVGTKIVSMSEDGHVLLKQFLQEYYWSKLDLRGAKG